MEEARCTNCEHEVKAYTLGGIITKVLRQEGSLKDDICPICKNKSFKLKLEG